ncbi:hypothetical protein ACVW0Y_004696 [Pseudomonas sp. TE3786]
MSFNLSQLPAAERVAIQQHRQYCFESYQRQLEVDAQLSVDAAWECSRLLDARGEKKAAWRDWVCEQLAAMDDPMLVAKIKRRLNGYLKGAGQSTHG